MVNSYSLSDDSGVMAAAAITHFFLFGQAVFSYLNGWSVLIGLVQVWTARAANTQRDLMGRWRSRLLS
ncbi:hypothetical protein [Escherichia coli]|uniref:hypothetical protein n=1 Tax=Escherichia coli TaxID=562 RepID=UPI0040698AA4